jgi:hypothetical protein
MVRATADRRPHASTGNLNRYQPHLPINVARVPLNAGFASLRRPLYGRFVSKEGSDAPAGFGNFDDLGGFGNVVGSLANV